MAEITHLPLLTPAWLRIYPMWGKCVILRVDPGKTITTTLHDKILKNWIHRSIEKRFFYILCEENFSKYWKIKELHKFYKVWLIFITHLPQMTLFVFTTDWCLEKKYADINWWMMYLVEVHVIQNLFFSLRADRNIQIITKKNGLFALLFLSLIVHLLPRIRSIIYWIEHFIE